MNSDPSEGARNHYRALAPVITGAFLISFSAVFVKLSVAGPTLSALYRMIFGALALLPFVLYGRRAARGARVSAPTPASAPVTQTPSALTNVLIACAGFTFALDLFVWHRSIPLIGPGPATVIANLQVFVVAALGRIFLGERPRRIFYLAAPAAFAGLWLILPPDALEKAGDARTGTALALATALIYGTFVFILRRVGMRADAPPGSDLMLRLTLWTGLCLIPALLLESGFVFTAEALAATWLAPDARTLAVLVAYGVLTQALGWFLISRGLPRVPAALAGLAILTQPTFAFLWDVLFFGRAAGLRELIGITITMGAVYAAARR